MAKTKTELIQLIRFGIQQLSARNGHMDLEHICRFFARARIHLNVLPATGPVQAGGDQGRDFETFHSYMSQCQIANTSFVGLFSDKPVAFACSFEQNPTKKNGKIESDVATILKSGVSVERIYFFSGQDIPVSKRHAVQERVRKKSKIDIDIIDASALAEHLSDPDLFWIASRYLDISNELYPIPEGPTWYSDLKAEHQRQNDEDRIPTFQEFSEIKSALRRIYKDQDLKVDLPFWFDKLRLYLDASTFRILKRKAIYEQFVAKLIGQNDVTNQEDLLRDYFSDFAEYRSPAALEDATNLLSFVCGSSKTVGHHIEQFEISAWQEKLGNILDEEYEAAGDSGKKVSLSVLRAQYVLQTAESDNLELAIQLMLSELQKAVPYFENAVFYPFEDLSNFVNHMLDILLGEGIRASVVEKLESFARLVDDEVGRRFGQQKSGEQLKRRAVQYFENKRYVEALDALHLLKVKWLNANSPKGTILAGLLIAKSYERLQLHYASRYYALAVAQIISKSQEIDLQHYLPQALSTVADNCYASGAWLHFVDILDLCILTHSISTKDFELYDEDRENLGIVFHPTIISYVTERFNLQSRHLFANRFKKWGDVSEEISESVSLAKSYYDGINDEQFNTTLQEQLSDVPFNDLGAIRAISFNIFGSQWSITFANDYATNGKAEQLAAIIQMMLLEFKTSELYLIKTDIRINFSLETDIQVPEEKDVSSNSDVHFQVKYPISLPENLETSYQEQAFCTALVISALRKISLLPMQELMGIVDTKFRESGLVGRLLFVATYENLYGYFFTKSKFEESSRQHFYDAQKFSQLRIKPNSNLPWNDSQAPIYDLENSLLIINNRLSFIYPYEITLPKLKASHAFNTVVNRLREKGWLDWQILLAVGNLIVNYKIRQVSPLYDASQAHAKAAQFYYKPEKDWYIPIPESVLTTERIERYLKTIHVLSVLPSFGLKSHSELPHFDAIQQLLTKRFNYMTDGADITVFA